MHIRALHKDYAAAFRCLDPRSILLAWPCIGKFSRSSVNPERFVTGPQFPGRHRAAFSWKASYNKLSVEHHNAQISAVHF